MGFSHFKITVFSTFMALVIAGTAHAEEPQLIGTFTSWSAYKLIENGNKVCYMISKPVTDEGNYQRRGDIYALVTHRPAENTTNVFSYMAGYPYKGESEAGITIDGRKYSLFTHEETAWAPDSNTDKQLANAIQSGSQMVVNGVSTKGTETTDTYSLKGSTAAYKAISKECGV